jgi:hypothetical protein
MITDARLGGRRLSLISFEAHELFDTWAGLSTVVYSFENGSKFLTLLKTVGLEFYT